jgi:hypothetical protein
MERTIPEEGGSQIDLYMMIPTGKNRLIQCYGLGGENQLSCVESSSLYSLFFKELLISIDVSNNANNFRLCLMKLNL